MTATSIEHVLVLSEDIEGTRDFYRDVVGLDAGDYDELLSRLERHGVAAVTNAVPGGPRQVFIEDPNGVRVVINVINVRSR